MKQGKTMRQGTKGTKVVYNSCYGGFSLSDEAIIEILKRKNISEDRITINKKDKSIGNKVLVDEKPYYQILDIYKLDRHDKDLVEVVQKLGEKANGFASKLKITTVYSKVYKIEEYDGLEKIIELDEENIYIIK